MLNGNTFFACLDEARAKVEVMIGERVVIAVPEAAHARLVAGAPVGVFLAYGQFKRSACRVAVNSPAVAAAELVPGASRPGRLAER